MNLKKMWKRFWNLNVHNHEGFTLVELIIVIAILAILSSVAVVGYSSYITKANMQADQTLAAEIKNALVLAMYSGELTPGDYVVIKFDGNASCGNGDVDSTTDKTSKIYQAMAAAYGDGWETMLKLKYAGWAEEIGVAGNKIAMEMVKGSNFTPESMDSLLSQINMITDKAGVVLEGVYVSEEIAALLSANGIDIKAGDILDETTSTAAANAYVYAVAGNLADMDFTKESDNWNTKEAEFMSAWMSGDFSSETLKDTITDPTTLQAAQYASVYALATYIDAQTDGAFGFVGQLDDSDDPRNDADKVLEKIRNSSDTDVQNAYAAYTTPTGTELPSAYKDAVSFISYMQGMDSSKDSLLKNTDLTNSQYYVDGYVANYVTNYLDLSDVLTAYGDNESAFAFIYTGSDVMCMPFDYK